MYNSKISGISMYVSTEAISTATKAFMYGKLSHGLSYMPIYKNYQYKLWQSQINKILHYKFTNKIEREKLGRYKIMSQPVLCKRAKILSAINWHRNCQVQRLNNILLTAYPAWELVDVMECLHVPNNDRNVRNISFFKNKRHNIIETKKTKTVMPMAWAVEFNRLPKEICKKIGTKQFSKKAKNYYFERCQHSETEIKFCRYCLKSTNVYQNDQMVSEYNRNIQLENNANQNANQYTNQSGQNHDKNRDTTEMENIRERMEKIKTGKVEGNVPSFLEELNATPDIYYVRNNVVWVAEQIRLLAMTKHRISLMRRNRM
jgi:hypothetical protein